MKDAQAMAKNRNERKPKKEREKPRAVVPREETPLKGRSVNLEVDRPWEMVENESLSKRVMGGRYGVRILAKSGRVPVGEFLEELRVGGNELGELMAQIEALCHAERKNHGRFSRPGRGKGRGVFELKQPGKLFRLFYFYGGDYGLADHLVICTHGFSKTKPSREEQDREFQRAARIRDEFLENRGQK